VILPCIDGDATKAEELDDVMLNAGIAYYFAAQKIIRQFLKKWKLCSAIIRSELIGRGWELL